jgi:2-polyprenyl-3-methyl-5-hydroxy-6-metoxy-1,4-benzoquinol methylase
MHAESRFSHNWLIKKLVNDKVRANKCRLHGSCIDLGCGEKPYEQEIRQHTDSYVGVDWGKSLHGIKAEIIADLNGPLPLESSSVHSVVSFEVLEHLAEPTVMLAEAFRILTPGGVLMMTVPFQWWVHEAPWDYYRYTRHGLEYLLTNAGFVEIQIEPISGFWSMWILKLNYQLVRLVRGSRATRWAIRAPLIPIWWLGQTIAPILDRHWPEDRETAGYFVIARKP